MEAMDKQNFTTKNKNKKYLLFENNFFGSFYLIDLFLILIFIPMIIGFMFLPFKWWVILIIDFSLLSILIMLIKPIGNYKVYEKITNYIDYKIRGKELKLSEYDLESEVWYEIFEGVNFSILTNEEIESIFDQLTLFTNTIKTDFKIVKTNFPSSLDENLKYLTKEFLEMKNDRFSDKEIENNFLGIVVDVLETTTIESKKSFLSSMFLVFDKEKISKETIENNLNILSVKYKPVERNDIKKIKYSILGNSIKLNENSRNLSSDNKKIYLSKINFGVNIAPNFLYGLLNEPNASFSLNVNYFEYEEIEKAKKKLVSNINSNNKVKNFIDEIKKENEERAREEVAIETILKGNEIISMNGYVSYVLNKDKHLSEYQKFINKLRVVDNIDLEKSIFRQKIYLDNFLKFNTKDEYSYITSSSTIGSSWPFQNSTLRDDKGFNIGNTETGHPWIWNPWSLSNTNIWHTSIFGKTRSGKTMLAQIISILNLVVKKTKVIILDPHNQYGEIFEKLGGKVIDVSDLKFNIISIINVDIDNFNKKIKQHVGVFRETLYLLFRRELQIDKTSRLVDELSNELLEFYQSRKYSIISGNVFKLDDFNDWLIINKKDEKYSDLINRLLVGRYSIFNNNESWDFLDEKVIVFNTKGIKNLNNSELIETINMLIFKFISDYSLDPGNNEDNKVSLIIDEAHLFLKDKTNLKTLAELMRESRKYWVNITIITQMISDLLKEEETKNDLITIFEQTGNRFYGNIDANEIKALNEILTLTSGRPLVENEINHFKNGDGSFIYTTDKNVRIAIKINLNKIPYITKVIIPSKQLQMKKEY